MEYRLTPVGLKGMGMVFGIGRRDAQDVQEAPQQGRVPYRLASYEHDHEGKKFKSSDVVYSFWSGAKYVLILSIILWWLPMFGQMIAGYVGGRRAGGPWRGVAASILPVVCLYIVVSGFDSGFLPSHVFGVAIAPAALAASLSESIPFFSPYIQFSSEYVGSFVDALAGASPYGINTYVLTVAFAYVGGILAEQSRREIEFTSGAMMSNTTVLVADGSQNQHQPQMAHRGLAHSFGSLFPWSRSHDGQEGAHVVSAPVSTRYVAHGQGNWSRAALMRYQEYEDARGGYVRALPAGPSEAEYQTFSRATTRKKHASSRKHHQTSRPHRRQDPWVRADRRAKKHYSSARRLRDAPPEHSQSEADGNSGRRWKELGKGSGPGVPRIVPGNARSLRRARKVIDQDWGRRQYPVLEDRSHRSSRHDISREQESHTPPASRESRRVRADNWDSI